MRIILKNTDRSLMIIPRFTRFLATSELKVVARRDDQITGQIELTINARIYGAAKWAAKLAQDCFESDLLGVYSDTGELLPFRESVNVS